MKYKLPKWCETWPNKEFKKAEKIISELNEKEQLKEKRLIEMLNTLIQPEPMEDEIL